jgi:ribosomal protein L37AE/L43A
MIVRCNQGCKKSDGFTDGSLDVDSNEAICNECGETLNTVSSYAKLSMKTNGDILRSKNRKAFMFPCQTCDTNVEAQFINGILVGKNCSNNFEGCKINVTEHMSKAIEEVQKRSELIEAEDAE